MKNIKIQTNKTKWLLLLLVFTIITMESFSQVKSENTEIKGKNYTYRCHIITREIGKGQVRKTKYYNNAKYDMEVILKDHRPNSPDALFISYSINNHDKFVNAFLQAFDKERIDYLSEHGVRFNVQFFLDKTGDILIIEFSSIGDKDIAPTEIEILENYLMDNITFKPLEHSEDAYPGSYTIRTNFNEIKQQEIVAIRKKEKR